VRSVGAVGSLWAVGGVGYFPAGIDQMVATLCADLPAYTVGVTEVVYSVAVTEETRTVDYAYDEDL
jgi:hypothetical protein